MKTDVVLLTFHLQCSLFNGPLQELLDAGGGELPQGTVCGVDNGILQWKTKLTEKNVSPWKPSLELLQFNYNGLI